MKKIIIFYASYGGGHLSAAKSIESVINEKYPNFETKLVDCMKYVNKGLEKITTAAYRGMAKKAPWAWGKIYNASQKGVIAHISTRSNAMMAVKLLKLLREENPDMVISAHPFSSQMCAYLKRKGKVNFPLATIMTDFAPHDQWLVGHEFTEFFFVAHDKMKEYLIAKGIPKDEIVFIHEADTEAKKKELFSKVRNGDVRVLIGSTQKMGAGTNVQDKLIALHHLDCPWRPSDLTQREGRIIRQGNQNEKVYTYTYVTEGTFDAYLYQLVEQKQKFISQIMTSKTPMRTMEDIDEKALSYGEIKALATGNPKILEKTNLDSDVAKLNLLKQDFYSQKYLLQDKIAKYYPAEIEKAEEKIAAMEEDTIKLQEYTKNNSDGFSPMKINGIVFTDKNSAGMKILECCKGIKSTDSVELGDYRGFKMNLTFDSVNREFKMVLTNKFSYFVELGQDIIGNITRINNCLEAIETKIPMERDKLDNTKIQLENAKKEVEKEFPQEQELQEKQKRLNELNVELKLNEQDKELFSDDKDDNEVQKDKNSRDDRNR